MGETLLEHAIYLSFGVSLVVMGAVSVVGFFVALLQAATQIQDQTLLFVPKFLALLLVGGAVAVITGEHFSELFSEAVSELSRVRP